MSSPANFTKVHDTKVDSLANGQYYESVYTFTGPSSYDNNGSALNLSTNIDQSGTLVDAEIVENNGDRTYEVRVDYSTPATPLMVVYVAATEAQVTGGVDLSGVTFRGRFRTLRNAA